MKKKENHRTQHKIDLDNRMLKERIDSYKITKTSTQIATHNEEEKHKKILKNMTSVVTKEFATSTLNDLLHYNTTLRKDIAMKEKAIKDEKARLIKLKIQYKKDSLSDEANNKVSTDSNRLIEKVIEEYIEDEVIEADAELQQLLDEYETLNDRRKGLVTRLKAFIDEHNKLGMSVSETKKRNAILKQNMSLLKSIGSVTTLALSDDAKSIISTNYDEQQQQQQEKEKKEKEGGNIAKVKKSNSKSTSNGNKGNSDDKNSSSSNHRAATIYNLRCAVLDKESVELYLNAGLHITPIQDMIDEKQVTIASIQAASDRMQAETDKELYTHNLYQDQLHDLLDRRIVVESRNSIALLQSKLTRLKRNEKLQHVDRAIDEIELDMLRQRLQKEVNTALH